MNQLAIDGAAEKAVPSGNPVAADGDNVDAAALHPPASTAAGHETTAVASRIASVSAADADGNGGMRLEALARYAAAFITFQTTRCCHTLTLTAAACGQGSFGRGRDRGHEAARQASSEQGPDGQEVPEEDEDGEQGAGHLAHRRAAAGVHGRGAGPRG